MKIIDALILEMQADASNFVKHFKDTREAGKKAKEESVRTLSDIEKAAASATTAFQTLALGVTAFFGGLLAANRLEQFSTQLNQTDAQLGRTARALGMAPGTLSIWEGMGQRLGVAAGSTAAAFANIADIVARSKLGERPAQLDMMRRMQAEGGVALPNINDMPAFLKALIANARNIAKKDPARAGAMMREAGFPADFVQNVVLSTRSIDDMLAEQEKIGKVTQADADAAQNLTFSLVGFQQAVQQIGRDIIANMGPAISAVLEKWQQWITANAAWIEQKIGENAKEFWDYVSAINWTALGTGITDFIDKVNHAADAMGGWIKLTEILFELWIGAKFVALLSRLSSIYLALTGASVIGGSGLLAAVIAFIMASYLMKRFFGGPEKRPEDIYKPGGGGLTSHQKAMGLTQAPGRLTMPGGGPPSGEISDIADSASSLAGKHVTSAEVRQYLSDAGKGTPTDLWCADFVGAALEHAGYKSLNTRAAVGYLNYGAPVEWKDTKKGDIIVEGRGRTVPERGGKGHVGIASGPAEMRRGRWVLPMISGDFGDHVEVHDWADPNTAVVRRATKDLKKEVAPPAPVTPEHSSMLRQHPATYAGAISTNRVAMINNHKMEHNVAQLVVHSRATDAHGIAHDMRLALRERFGSVA